MDGGYRECYMGCGLICRIRENPKNTGEEKLVAWSDFSRRLCSVERMWSVANDPSMVRFLWKYFLQFTEHLKPMM